MSSMRRLTALSAAAVLFLSGCASESTEVAEETATGDVYESLTGTANPYMGMDQDELASVAAEVEASNNAAISSIMAEPIPGSGPQPELCKLLGNDFLADEGYLTFEGAWVTTPELGDEACNYTKADGMDSHGLTIKEMSPREQLPVNARFYHEQVDVEVPPSVPGAFITRFEFWDDNIYSCAAAAVHGEREYHAEFSVTHGDGSTGEWRELCPEAMRLLGKAMEKIA